MWVLSNDSPQFPAILGTELALALLAYFQGWSCRQSQLASMPEMVGCSIGNHITLSTLVSATKVTSKALHFCRME